MVLIGTNVKGRANFMAAGWFTMANMRPTQLIVSIGKGRHTLDGIRENGTFSISLATADMVVKTDYCGLASGKNTDKSKVFDVFYGETKTAPLVQESPLTAECKVVNTIDLPDHTLVIGELVAAYVDGEYESGGRLDIVAMRPLLLSMPDNNYWLPGEVAGKAWSDGKKLGK
jgi:flavin reductase (DIM6/NTAB) family NADH-FMN oxidoreductase RutF